MAVGEEEEEEGGESAYSADVADWYYLDVSGQEQGPFDGERYVVAGVCGCERVRAGIGSFYGLFFSELLD